MRVFIQKICVSLFTDLINVLYESIGHICLNSLPDGYWQHVSHIFNREVLKFTWSFNEIKVFEERQELIKAMQGKLFIHNNLDLIYLTPAYS